jgi:hypothetical protein
VINSSHSQHTESVNATLQFLECSVILRRKRKLAIWYIGDKVHFVRYKPFLDTQTHYNQLLSIIRRSGGVPPHPIIRWISQQVSEKDFIEKEVSVNCNKTMHCSSSSLQFILTFPYVWNNLRYVYQDSISGFRRLVPMVGKEMTETQHSYCTSIKCSVQEIFILTLKNIFICTLQERTRCRNKSGNIYNNSASARISKGQGYQGFLRKRAVELGREQFWPKKGNLRRTRKNEKNGQNFTLFRVNKMFFHKF